MGSKRVRQNLATKPPPSKDSGLRHTPANLGYPRAQHCRGPEPIMEEREFDFFFF